MENLKETLAYYSDEQLIEEYNKHREDYTEEAQKVFEEEIASRGIGVTSALPAQEPKSSASAAKPADVLAPGARIGREDFLPFDLVFAKTDILTANAVLRDSKVPYFVEECGENSGSGGSDTFRIYVYKDAVEEATAIIEEHFCKGTEGKYILRESDIINRLKSFSFYDIAFSDAAANEILDTSFCEEESAALINLAQALIEEAEAIEEEREIVVFFYDSMEQLISKLKANGGFTRTDFLAILEICQIYCEDERYDSVVLNKTVSSILSFFLE